MRFMITPWHKNKLLNIGTIINIISVPNIVPINNSLNTDTELDISIHNTGLHFSNEYIDIGKTAVSALRPVAHQEKIATFCLLFLSE